MRILIFFLETPKSTSFDDEKMDFANIFAN